MTVSILERTEEYVVLSVKIGLSETMLESEENIQTALNAAGTVASREVLQKFDTDGSAFELEGRHVYQTSSGGTTFCPLEVDGRIIVTSTPRFAQQIAHKYAEMIGGRVLEDLRENHGRDLPLAFVQILAEAVGAIALAKAEDWHDQTPKQAMPIPMISIGIDGTCMWMCQDGFRQAMVGTISLYDAAGARQHSTYIAAAPEAGKAIFLNRMAIEIAQVKRLYPNAHYQGLTDGAADNWQFLTPHTDSQVIDFYHATEYLADVAQAMHPTRKAQRAIWLETACHDLKHNIGAAADLLNTMAAIPTDKLAEALQTDLKAAITYFRNHHHQMHYAEALTDHLPIGSAPVKFWSKRVCAVRE